MYVWIHVLEHSVEELFRVLPFLFLSYFLIECIEHKMNIKMKQFIFRVGKAGPVLGALAGMLPQCGFSAAAAGLFAGGIISPGTMIAVFLSTSDEMLPIIISSGMAPEAILKIILTKVIVGIVVGLLTDFAAEKLFGRRRQMPEQSKLCEERNCGCREHGIFYAAFRHTIKTGIFLFVISAILGVSMEVFESYLENDLQMFQGMAVLISGLIGMTPNCAASVVITQLYLKEVIESGAFFSGILCGAGTGLLILWRENCDRKTSLILTGLLYVSGVIAGSLLGLLGII